ncbi:MAG: BPSL0067 family protein [Acidiferrobacterales bacterium]|nr:BPSL0067 family protein [Acidiferrobacterales bacterium]
MKKRTNIKTLYLGAWATLALSACVRGTPSNCANCTNQVDVSTKNYICTNAQAYQGQVIGDGHCVSFIKYCSGAPNTIDWHPGEKVWKNDIRPGTIIATFKNNRYPNKTGYHAAIYIEQDAQGIWVWDQWQGKAVHKRLIRWRQDNAADGNTAQSYRTVAKE